MRERQKTHFTNPLCLKKYLNDPPPLAPCGRGSIRSLPPEEWPAAEAAVRETLAWALVEGCPDSRKGGGGYPLSPPPLGGGGGSRTQWGRRGVHDPPSTPSSHPGGGARGEDPGLHPAYSPPPRPSTCPPPALLLQACKARPRTPRPGGGGARAQAVPHSVRAIQTVGPSHILNSITPRRSSMTAVLRAF